MQTFIQIVEEAAGCFTVSTRNDGKKFTHTADAPEWIQRMCSAAHGDMMPDDWRYEHISAVLDAIKDYGSGDAEPDDLDEWRHEIVDGLVDIYTHNLTAWSYSNQRLKTARYLRA